MIKSDIYLGLSLTSMFLWISFFRIPCVISGENIHKNSAFGEQNPYKGRYSRDTRLAGDYEIVVPRKVRANGEFLSHELPHHYKRSYYKGRRRSDMTPDDSVHYRITMDGEEHHLELYPNHNLLGPGAVVERRSLEAGQPATDVNFLRSSDIRRLRDTECHYHGGVRGHYENSALSTCYGLAGYIRTKRALYSIEPVADHDFTSDLEHPHIVYKRSVDANEGNNGTLCNIGRSLAEEMNKRKVITRRKRTTSKKNERTVYTLELLVVLDKSVLSYCKDRDVENYALTLFNMAAGLFRDASLGVEMELAIVRIVQLEAEEDEMNSSLTKDRDSAMTFFQQWQRKMNPGDDSHPNHHDCAVLITRVDICSSQSLCGFTGMSTIAGTCDPLKSAAIVKDNGLRTGYHIAHQIGHTLGMSHDSEQENGCLGMMIGHNSYVETTVMYAGSPYVTKKWSKCSQTDLNIYFETGKGTCLVDEAQDHQFAGTDMLPGVMYDGNDQCRILYRKDARQCDFGVTCDALKCAVMGENCLSQRIPPADGTTCGEKMWCYQMKCLPIGERPGAIDGGWSDWSPWSQCTRTCGSGVAFSERKCNHPRPSNGGENCKGVKKRHKICATVPCEIGAPSFRDVQCAEFDDWIFPEDGRTHRWTGYNLSEMKCVVFSMKREANCSLVQLDTRSDWDPLESWSPNDFILQLDAELLKDLKASENPCVLFCTSETSLLASLKPKVIDGTTCYRGIRDICIGGTCEEIPCDLDMESNAVEDRCGVCKGDGTSCTTKEGTRFIPEQQRLKKLLDVPKGARNIRVEETQPSKARIVVRSKGGKNVLIEGNRLGMFDVPGSKAWLGTIRARQEALNIPGPVTEDLVVLVYPKENSTFKFSMGLHQDRPRKAEFAWDYVDWSRCDAPCGPGEETSIPRCVEKIGGMVDDSFCTKIPKPDTKIRPCNHGPCVPRWMIGEWQGCEPCTAGCKKQRAVKCIRPVGHGEQEVDVIAENYCQGPMPKESRECEIGTRELNERTSPKEEPITVRDHGMEAISKNQSSGMAGKQAILSSDEKSSTKLPRSSEIRKRIDDNGTTNRHVTQTRKINTGQTVVDEEDANNLTLTIILERDDLGNIKNFPKDFEPRPSTNGTEFTLVGTDAVRYIRLVRREGDTFQFSNG